MTARVFWGFLIGCFVIEPLWRWIARVTAKPKPIEAFQFDAMLQFPPGRTEVTWRELAEYNQAIRKQLTEGT
jgi:hypothetical protein